GDSVRVEDAALLEPVPESPQLDLSADPADVWKLRAYLVQQGLLAHRRRSADLVALRNPAFDHALDRRLLHDPRVPHASAQAGGVAAVAASRGALSVLRVPGGGPRAQRAPGAGGAHAAAAGALPGVPGYRENLIGRLNPAFVYKRAKKGALNTPLYTNRVRRLRAADRAVHEPGDTELRSRQGPELEQRDDHQRADEDRPGDDVAAGHGPPLPAQPLGDARAEHRVEERKDEQQDDHHRPDADREDELVAQLQELEQEQEVPVRSRDGDRAGVGGRLE